MVVELAVGVFGHHQCPVAEDMEVAIEAGMEVGWASLSLFLSSDLEAVAYLDF